MSQLAPAPPLLPPLTAAAYVVVVAGAGVFINCGILAAILRTSKNGVSSIVMQLALADVVLGIVIPPEIWSLNDRSWSFGSRACALYHGLNVFASTALVYLTAALGLHSLAKINLEERHRKIRISSQEEIRSSQHNLVTNSDSSTPPRSMTVDYRLANTRVPIKLPTIFVWILATSLSIPEFILAMTASDENGTVTCALDNNHRYYMQIMLSVFMFFVPFCLLCTIGVLAINKLKSKARPRLNSCLGINTLKLSLGLIIVYGICCVPRSLFDFLIVSLGPNTAKNNYFIQPIELACSATYLLTILIRPLMYILLLPRLQNNLLFRDIAINV